LGLFGLGAKVVSSYRSRFITTSRYNGESLFHVYKDHVVSAIAKFEDDIVNEVEIFFEGLDNEYSVYHMEAAHVPTKTPTTFLSR
jgi:hypothetical protein